MYRICEGRREKRFFIRSNSHHRIDDRPCRASSNAVYGTRRRNTQETNSRTMDVEGNQEIIDEICDYCEKHQIKELLGEYMKRIVLAKPKEPIKFLLKSIQENPYEPPQSKQEK